MTIKKTLEEWEKVFNDAIVSNQEFLCGRLYKNSKKKLNSTKRK